MIDATGTLINPAHNEIRMRYEGISRVPAVPPAKLRAAATDYPDDSSHFLFAIAED